MKQRPWRNSTFFPWLGQSPCLYSSRYLWMVSFTEAWADPSLTMNRIKQLRKCSHRLPADSPVQAMDKGYYRNSQPIDVQGSISGELRHRWSILLTPTYKVQGPLWEREQNDCKRQRFGSTGVRLYLLGMAGRLGFWTHTRAKHSTL